MSLQKPTMKSLEKLMMEMNEEIKQLKTDLGKCHIDLRKGQKDLVEEMRKLKNSKPKRRKFLSWKSLLISLVVVMINCKRKIRK